MTKTVKMVVHPSGKIVVNMPGSGMRPHVYKDKRKAMELIDRLLK